MYEVAVASYTLGEANSGMENRQRILSISCSTTAEFSSISFSLLLCFLLLTALLPTQQKKYLLGGLGLAELISFSPFLIVLQNCKRISHPPPALSPPSIPHPCPAPHALTQLCFGKQEIIPGLWAPEPGNGSLLPWLPSPQVLPGRSILLKIVTAKTRRKDEMISLSNHRLGWLQRELIL